MTSIPGKNLDCTNLMMVNIMPKICVPKLRIPSDAMLHIGLENECSKCAQINAI